MRPDRQTILAGFIPDEAYTVAFLAAKHNSGGSMNDNWIVFLTTLAGFAFCGLLAWLHHQELPVNKREWRCTNAVIQNGASICTTYERK